MPKIVVSPLAQADIDEIWEPAIALTTPERHLALKFKERSIRHEAVHHVS
jgi:plasmid stabilization system protein ParE